ncbi:MAG: DNA modification methylase [Armatimonadia bacterium]
MAKRTAPGIAKQEYELVPIAAIQPHPRNVNVGDVAAIVESIQANQFFGACLVQRSSRNILAGKHRWLAAKECGLEMVPVIYADVDDRTALRMVLADNRTCRLGADDPERLADLLQDILADTGSLVGTGFDQAALDELLSSLNAEQVPAEGLTDADATPEPPVAPVTLPGDLWRLGPHRVLCGDSTASEAVSRLLGATVPFLMVTDPPYGVEYDPEWRNGHGGFSDAPVKQTGKVANDDRVDWSPVWALFPGSVAYVWHAGVKAAEVAISLFAEKFDIRAQIIWAKQQGVMSRGAYHWQHEPCWYAVRKGQTSHWKGDRKQTTVWQVQSLNPTGNREEERVGHGTQKPIELMRRPIVNHTERGEAIYDPFLGSGTTLIACEKEGRVCYGIDIDPKYVDVIVKRWQDFTGQQATLDGDGATFEHVKAGRLQGHADALMEEALEATR